jgi:hypothetical protein
MTNKKLIKLKKGDLFRITFFTRANGFKGGGTRVLIGRCLFLQTRRSWVILHFNIILKYIKFFFKIPLYSPLIIDLRILKNDTKKKK